MTDTTIEPGKSAPLVHVPAPDLPPPASSVGAIGWARRNLVSSPTNTALTVLALALLYLIIPPIFNWVVWDATFIGTSREDCTGAGACG